MAKIETGRVVASSLDNFIVFQNQNSQQSPYVSFAIGDSAVGQNVNITIKDAEKDDGVSFSIAGRAGAYVTSETFNTAGDRFSLMFSLCECLKLNPYTYNVVIFNTNTVRCGLDSSRKWDITSNRLTVGGNFAQYNPYSVNKWVLNIRGNIDENIEQFSMAKYNDTPEVSFNVTSPFQYITFKNPIKVSLSAYSLIGNATRVEPITNNSLTVMPTTLSKFEKVNYDEYFCSMSNYEVKKPLTRNFKRYCNYGDVVGISILTDRGDSSVTVTKRYYTNSGVFLSSETGYLKRYYTNYRMDFYTRLNIEDVENTSSRQVGYVEVTVSVNGHDITEPVRYTVVPKCTTTDTLFFINAIGGLDSFTFLGGLDENSAIDEQEGYFKNPKRPYTSVYDLEYVKWKSMDETYTAKTHTIDRETAHWLKELQRSKYVFKYDTEDTVPFKMVIVDEFNIELPTDENRFRLECTYRYADSGINI